MSFTIYNTIIEQAVEEAVQTIDNQLPNFGIVSISGTTNQINSSNVSGDVTLSIAQNFSVNRILLSSTLQSTTPVTITSTSNQVQYFSGLSSVVTATLSGTFNNNQRFEFYNDDTLYPVNIIFIDGVYFIDYKVVPQSHMTITYLNSKWINLTEPPLYTYNILSLPMSGGTTALNAIGGLLINMISGSPSVTTTLKLPNASYLNIGTRYTIKNPIANTLIIVDFDNNPIAVGNITSNNAIITLAYNVTSAGIWIFTRSG